MAVYVDDMAAKFGRMLMCHMIAETHAELVAMADRIGVARKWIQQAGNHGEHFDICQSKRLLAVKYGAVEIPLRDLAEHTAKRRNPEGKALYYGTEPAPDAERGEEGAK